MIFQDLWWKLFSFASRVPEDLVTCPSKWPCRRLESALSWPHDVDQTFHFVKLKIKISQRSQKKCFFLFQIIKIVCQSRMMQTKMWIKWKSRWKKSDENIGRHSAIYFFTILLLDVPTSILMFYGLTMFELFGHWRCSRYYGRWNFSKQIQILFKIFSL